MKKTLISLVCLVGLALPTFAGGRTLVLKDGSSMEASEIQLIRGKVQVKLPGGRFLAYDPADVDLEASGLVEKKPEEWIVSESEGRFGAAIAREAGGVDSLQITDQDVGHVDPDAEEEQPEPEKEDEGPAFSIEVQDVDKSLKDGILTVTGKVVNTGFEKVDAIALMAIALDEDNKDIAHGSTGIPVLEAGKSSAFAIAMAVPGPVANVTVRARAIGTETSPATGEEPSENESTTPPAGETK